MLRNYFKITLRNLLRHTTFSFINIFGLAIAMSASLLIILMYADQKKYDQFHENKDRVFRIISTTNNSVPYATSPMPLKSELLDEYDGVEDVVRLKMMFGGDLTYKENTIPLAGFYSDESFFKVFGFELENGDPSTALSNPYSLVLTKEASIKLFGEEDPVGKIIKFNDRGLNTLGIAFDTKDIFLGDFTVTGVLKEAGYKSHIRFDLLGSMSTLPILISKEIDEAPLDNWKNNYDSYTYILMKEGSAGEDLQPVLDNITKTKYADFEDFEVNFEMQALTAITPGRFLSNPMSFRMPKEGFYFLSFLALIVILSACFNYTNLSVARTLTRAKEIGIRKINGAYKSQIFTQFISEAVLISLFALIFSVLLLQILKQGFVGLWLNQYLSISLQENIGVVIGFVAFAIVIGFIAGIVPAMYLSSFQPLNILKKGLGKFSGKKGTLMFNKPTLGKSLIIIQFTFSLILIISTTLLFSQLGHLSKAEYGFNRENIVNIRLQGNDYNVYTNAVNSYSEVSRVSASSLIPATGFSEGTKLIKQDGSLDSIGTFYMSVDPNYIQNLDLKIVAGRDLPEDPDGIGGDFIIVNETATVELGYDAPGDIVGDVFLSRSHDRLVEVVGVVEDFYYDLFMEDIGSLVFGNEPDKYRYANVRITGNNLNETVIFLENEWKKIDQVHSFEYKFFDQQLANSHAIFGDVISVIGFISTLAVSIACLGLLGMAVFTAETRQKEIGIRKALGADVSSILYLLSKGFIALLVVSIILAVPIAYFLNNLWLQEFAYRVDFGAKVMGIAVSIMIALGLLTIGSQTLKASFTNPATTLQNE